MLPGHGSCQLTFWELFLRPLFFSLFFFFLFVGVKRKEIDAFIDVTKVIVANDQIDRRDGVKNAGGEIRDLVALEESADPGAGINATILTADSWNWIQLGNGASGAVADGTEAVRGGGGRGGVKAKEGSIVAHKIFLYWPVGIVSEYWSKRN